MKLIDYITGNRKGREARRIEREAMDDPFLHVRSSGLASIALRIVMSTSLSSQ